MSRSERHHPHRVVALVAVSMMLLTACANQVAGGGAAPLRPSIGPGGPPQPRTAAAAGAAAAEEQAPKPVRIDVPGIDVTARVVPLGTEPDGSLEVPSVFADTGWWTDGPEPGERGPAVIAGHVDSQTGPAVFYRLEQLNRADEIRVTGADGTARIFLVERVERHPKDAFPTQRVYGDTDEPMLRLITCGGDFNRSTGHYVDNIIVFARLGR